MTDTPKQKGKNESLVSRTIMTGITLILLFLESIFILSRVFRKGIFKKEVLSRTTDLGFNFKIIMKG